MFKSSIRWSRVVEACLCTRGNDLKRGRPYNSGITQRNGILMSTPIWNWWRLQGPDSGLQPTGINLLTLLLTFMNQLVTVGNLISLWSHSACISSYVLCVLYAVLRDRQLFLPSTSRLQLTPSRFQTSVHESRVPRGLPVLLCKSGESTVSIIDKPPTARTGWLPAPDVPG
jgi:hypothetical protein